MGGRKGKRIGMNERKGNTKKRDDYGMKGGRRKARLKDNER